MRHSITGSPETVKQGLEKFVDLTKADELMIVTSIYDHPARIRSYELVAEIMPPKGTKFTKD